MQRQYKLIDECLHALRESDILPKQKLQLEVQLLQIKLLLLRDDVRRDIRRKFCSEGALQTIQQQLRGLDESEARDVSIKAIGRDLRQIRFGLAEAITKVPSGD